MKKSFLIKILKIKLALLAMLLIAASGWTAYHWNEMKLFPSILSGYYSKMMCSCLFVMNRPEADCHNMVRYAIPISSNQISWNDKQVTTTALGHTRSARFKNARFGCELEY